MPWIGFGLIVHIEVSNIHEIYLPRPRILSVYMHASINVYLPCMIHLWVCVCRAAAFGFSVALGYYCLLAALFCYVCWSHSISPKVSPVQMLINHHHHHHHTRQFNTTWLTAWQWLLCLRSTAECPTTTTSRNQRSIIILFITTASRRVIVTVIVTVQYNKHNLLYFWTF